MLHAIGFREYIFHRSKLELTSRLLDAMHHSFQVLFNSIHTEITVYFRNNCLFLDQERSHIATHLATVVVVVVGEKLFNWRSQIFDFTSHLSLTMPAMTSFHVEKSCHLVNAHTASARRIYSSVRQLSAITSVYSSRSTVHS